MSVEGRELDMEVSRKPVGWLQLLQQLHRWETSQSVAVDLQHTQREVNIQEPTHTHTHTPSGHCTFPVGALGGVQLFKVNRNNICNT